MMHEPIEGGDPARTVSTRELLQFANRTDEVAQDSRNLSTLLFLLEGSDKLEKREREALSAITDIATGLSDAAESMAKDYASTFGFTVPEF